MGQSIVYRGGDSKRWDSQPKSTSDNESQQRDCAGPGEIAEPSFVDERIVRMCKSELDAVNLCIDLSRLSDETLCDKLGIDKGHWSRMRKGRAHFPTAKRIALMHLAGNWAPIQYELGVSGVGRRLQELWKSQQREKPAEDSWQSFGVAA